MPPARSAQGAAQADGGLSLRVTLGLLRLSWAEWRAHPWRQASTVLAIALGVALAFSVHLINRSALAEFSSAVRAANGNPDLSLGAPQGLDDRWLDRVLDQPEVAQAMPRIEVRTLAFAPDGSRFGVQVIGLDALRAARVAPRLLPQPARGSASASAGGSASTALAPLDPDQIFINPALKRRLGAATELHLVAGGRTQTLHIGGSVAAPGEPLAVLDIASAQARFGLVGRLSGIDIRLQPGASADALVRRLALPPAVQATTPQDDRDRVSNLSRAYRVNLTVLALVALVVGAFLVFSVLSLAVAQRTPGFALLGVLGMSAAERRTLVLAECLVTGLVASGLGVLLGTGLALAALDWLAGDLGGGYFPGERPPLQFDGWAAAGFAALGTLAAVAGGWWPARLAARISPAQALKGLSQPDAGTPPWLPGVALCATGGALALLPPVAGLPLAAYASVAALLVGGIVLVPYAVHALLGRRGAQPPRQALWLLATERARFHRATATAAVAGVVASLALSVALTVMVASFRDAVSQWLDVILPADLYVRADLPASGSDQVFFPPGWVAASGRLPGVARAQGARSLALSLSPDLPDVWLLARSLQPSPAQALPLVGNTLPASIVRPGEVGIYVSEAMVDLHGAKPGSLLRLPLPLALHGAAAAAAAPAGAGASANITQPGPASTDAARGTPAELRGRVLGVWRDFARQFGSVAVDIADYQRATGDTQTNELALWLQPGAPADTLAHVQAALRHAMNALGGDERVLSFASTAELKRLSLSIFDRSFAVTRYLQVVAMAIGLAGIAASLSAQVLARRREFGLLSHLGLTRRQVMALVAAETAAWLVAGTAVGLLLGVAISVVLVDVVNPQSFHWTMDLRLPLPQLAGLALGVLVAGLATSLFTARHAASSDAVRSVKEDW